MRGRGQLLASKCLYLDVNCFSIMENEEERTDLSDSNIRPSDARRIFEGDCGVTLKGTKDRRLVWRTGDRL